jgi:C-terminal processing protease CtpA/Prc
VPLYIKNRHLTYWFEHLPQAKTVYFQFNSVRNDPQEPLDALINRLFKFINESEVEKLIIDMRWNNGGNTVLAQPLIHRLISNEKINQRGKLFVIIGRRTFSAAQNTATFIERHTNAIFVGEPTGAGPNFIGEEDPVTLPYSKIPINVSDVFWQSSWPFDQRTWIGPEIYVPPTFEAYRANRDPALEAILAYRTKP